MPYDHVWCVVDVDQHESLDQAFDRARANSLSLAITNPCFEYWYILHFERTSRLFSSTSDVLTRLRRHYSAYTKNHAGTFAVVYPMTEQAIRNAEGVIREKGYGEDLRKCNPSTHVHRLVKLLLVESEN